MTTREAGKLIVEALVKKYEYRLECRSKLQHALSEYMRVTMELMDADYFAGDLLDVIHDATGEQDHECVVALIAAMQTRADKLHEAIIAADVIKLRSS